jgi:hypothetical protein
MRNVAVVLGIAVLALLAAASTGAARTKHVTIEHQPARPTPRIRDRPLLE